jgi:hypothetical protein
MILKFDKFGGKLKNNNLEREEVIELVSLITDLKPIIPSEIETTNISKLIDNVNQYISDCGNYKISVYFRESDVYHNSDGTVTTGQFKSLYKITISSEHQLKIEHLKDFIILTSDIIKEVYPDCKIAVKLLDNKLSIDEFSNLEDVMVIEKLILIIRII